MYDGSEQLTFKDTELGSSVLDFWSWAYSDLIRNVNRGAFAEFIVLGAMNNQSGITPPPPNRFSGIYGCIRFAQSGRHTCRSKIFRIHTSMGKRASGKNLFPHSPSEISGRFR